VDRARHSTHMAYLSTQCYCRKYVSVSKCPAQKDMRCQCMLVRKQRSQRRRNGGPLYATQLGCWAMYPEECHHERSSQGSEAGGSQPRLLLGLLFGGLLLCLFHRGVGVAAAPRRRVSTRVSVPRQRQQFTYEAGQLRPADDTKQQTIWQKMAETYFTRTQMAASTQP